MIEKWCFRVRRLVRPAVLACAIVFCLTPIPSMAQSGTDEALNRLEVRLVEAVMAEDYRVFLAYLQEFEALGGTVVPDMIFYKAVALQSEGDILGAHREIERFLGRVTSAHSKHRDARALLHELAAKTATVQELQARLSSAAANNEKLTILYEYAFEAASDEDKREAIRRIAEIEDPLTDSTPDRRFEIDLSTSQIAFSRNGSVLAVLTGNRLPPTSIYILDASDGRHLLSSPGQSNSPAHNSRTSIGFLPGKDLLAMAYRDGAIGFFRYDGGGQQFKLKAPGSGEFDPIKKISFSSDGTRAAAVHDSGVVIVYDVDSRQPVWTMTPPDYAGVGPFVDINIALSPDGKKLVTSLYRDVSLWDVEARTRLLTVQAKANIVDLVYAADGTSFAIADDYGVRFYDAMTGSPGRRHIGHDADVRFGSKWVPKVAYLGVSPSGRYVSASRGSISHTESGRVYYERGTVNVYEPDGRLVAILTGFGEDGSCRRPEPRDCRGIDGVALSDDGRTLAAAGSDGYVRIWDLP